MENVFGKVCLEYLKGESERIFALFSAGELLILAVACVVLLRES